MFRAVSVHHKASWGAFRGCAGLMGKRHLYYQWSLFFLLLGSLYTSRRPYWRGPRVGLCRLFSPHLVHIWSTENIPWQILGEQANLNIAAISWVLPSKQLACLSPVDRFPSQEVDPVTMLPNSNGDLKLSWKFLPPLTWSSQKGWGLTARSISI